MNWTKIPTNLLISRIPDNELVAIVKYQLLWADLEYQPTDEIALRYMTNKQLSSVKHYLNDIETQVVSDIKSTISHRGNQKMFYKKKQSLKQNADSQCDSQYDNQCDNQADGADKIRLDKIRKEKELSDDNSKKKFTEDSIIAVNGQYFDEFPSECMPLLKKYWSVSEIEEIRKDLACQPDNETTITKLLETYPPKQKQEDRTLEIQFNAFWEVYPKQRKAGKTKPREKFFQIIKSGKVTAEQIIKSAEDYAKTDEVARGFAKEPYSWLLNERYLCDYTIKQALQMPMSAKERTDMINKQKTQAILQTMREKGLLQ